MFCRWSGLNTVPGNRLAICILATLALAAVAEAMTASAAGAWTTEGDQNYANYGWSVATAGDVNGDGYADVIVGAFDYSGGQPSEGRAYVFHGGPIGLSATPAWTAEGDQAYAHFGFSVSTAGDVNGDGYDDVIVGADGYDGDGNDRGRAYVYLGGASGVAGSPAWTADGLQNDYYFGRSVAAAGDVNGDGYADVIIGADGYDNGQNNEGGAFVYCGSDTGLADDPCWVSEGGQDGALFGHCVASAGDVNGDDFDDVIVGAYWFSNGEQDEGRAFVFLGGPAGLAGSPVWTAEGDQAFARFGWSVASAGDVNGDGFDDVIVGAYYYDNGEPFEGRAFVYHGAATGVQAGPAWTGESDQGNAFYAYSVASAGDVNGDGYAEVIVGAPQYGDEEPQEGRAYIYRGTAGGVTSSDPWIVESDQDNAKLGWSVAAAGDVNLDNYADIIVGVPYYDNDQSDEGRAIVLLGSEDVIAVLVSGVSSFWADDHIVISWNLRRDAAIRDFTVTALRRANGQAQYEPIEPLEVDRAGDRWTIRDRTAVPGETYTYRICIAAAGGPLSTFDVQQEAEAPALLLHLNHPNPFNPGTRLSFTLPQGQMVRLDIVDVAGRQVRVLKDEVMPAGKHEVTWNGCDDAGRPLSSGVYFYRLRTENRVDVGRCLLVK